MYEFLLPVAQVIAPLVVKPIAEGAANVISEVFKKAGETVVEEGTKSLYKKVAELLNGKDEEVKALAMEPDPIKQLESLTALLNMICR